MALAKEKSNALAASLTQIEKQFGKDKVFKLGTGPNVQVDRRSTGLPSLDQRLSGGLPAGRVVEIYGPEASGKTSLVLQCIGQAQKDGGSAAFIDAEHALDPVWAETLGVNIDDLSFSQPDSGEQALEIVDLLVRSGAFDIIAVDSVAALTPKAEIEGEMGDSHVGLQARLMSQALRKITSSVKNSGTTVIFINQLRMKIGVPFGSPETTSGGNALKFYASVRMDTRRVERIKRGDEVVGAVTRVKLVKNKVGRPFTKADLPLYFDRGFCAASSLLEVAMDQGLITQNGTWYSAEGHQVCQGRERLVQMLRDDAAFYDRILAQTAVPSDTTKNTDDTPVSTNGAAA